MGKKCCEVFLQSGKKERGMGGGDKQLSDIDIAVALESLNGGVNRVQEAVLRIEVLCNDLPCEDYLERIVRLEKDRDSHEKMLVVHLDHIEKIYKITRLQGEAIATLTQENKGQAFLSDKMWGLLGLFLGAGTSALVYFLTRG